MADSSPPGATEHGPVQKRIASRSKISGQWANAAPEVLQSTQPPPLDPPEPRLAANNVAYSGAQFLEGYGDAPAGQVLQSTAPLLPSPPPPPPATPLPSVTPPPPPSQVLQSTVSLPALLSPSDLQRYRTAHPKRLAGLQDEARAILNCHANAPPNDPADVSEAWHGWRSYVASHEQGLAIIGAGIAKVTAEFVPNTKDANRGNKPRTDLFLHRVDGSAVRIHPGSTRKRDAKPVEVPRVLQSTALTVTSAALQAIPQGDRMSHIDALQTLWRLVPMGPPCSWRLAPGASLVDLTDESLFPWTLFVANVAEAMRVLAEETIGEVCLVHPSRAGQLVTLRITTGGSPPHVHNLHLRPVFRKGVLVRAKSLLQE